MSEETKKIDRYIGQRLRILRKLRNITQIELAKIIGFSPMQLYKYEGGVNQIGAGKLYVMAKILGVNVGFFFKGYEDHDADPMGDLLVSVDAICGKENAPKA